MLTDRHTGTLPALFAISGESRIKGFFKIRFQAIPVLKIKEQTVQTWGGALLAPPPSPREPGVHVQMWARTQRRSRLKVGFSPSFRKQGSARAGTRHGGVGAARRRPLTSLIWFEQPLPVARSLPSLLGPGRILTVSERWKPEAPSLTSVTRKAPELLSFLSLVFKTDVVFFLMLNLTRELPMP